MKKLISIALLFFVFSFLLSSQASAQSSTPAPTSATKPPENLIDKQINALKDRIASRVAELKLVEKRGAIGDVTQTSDTQLTILDINKEQRFIDVDELTKFASPSAKGSFGISDITKGTKIGVLGLFNKQSRRILARFIDVLILPETVKGHIIGIDSSNFQFTVATVNGHKIIDVESTTKTSFYTKDAGILRGGFSKLKEGQRVIVIGYSNKKDSTRISAQRILLFPEIPKNPNIKEDVPKTVPLTPTPTPTPTNRFVPTRTPLTTP